MYIKSVTIDGFKSYGNRTEITGFDPEFNAITGLNGTGKSNILDSICFVLGISNLTHVRANSLQDLIYKSGQAGVTKASVSIIFDNSDKSKSPINYEHCSEISVTRQITVAGKNRYMINSSSATNKTVADFFNSIQLNVNNPHFLIMQGRITKVLNMKPPEILSMIEEAAGTRMYENKKTDAQKVIERKDGKMKEIDSLVVEQINPKLQRMKEDRNHYVEYQSICRSLENYSKLKTAWEFVNLEETYENLEKDLTSVNEKLTNLEKTVADKKERIGALDQEIVQIQSDLDKETGGQLQGLESTLKEAEKNEAKASAEAKSMQETITVETKNLKHLQKTINDDAKALELKRSEMEKAQDVFDSLRKAEEEDAEALTLAQKKYQAVCSGLLESEDGDNATLQDQLMAVKQQVSEAETEMKKCTLQIQLDKKNLASKKPLLKKTEADFAHDKKELNSKENELKSLRESLSKCQYTEGQLENLQNRARELQAEYRSCHDIVTNFSHQFPQLNFQYSDPEPNFDRRKVKGLTCKLFSMKDDQYAQALEAAAGGKLYNVVTDNEDTSAKLIERGRLTKRATFAPLNKVRGYSIEASIVRRAQQEYGPNNVFLAKDLINYQPEFESIMAWMFGQTLICSTIDIAESLCTKYMKKTVSIDGSSFDPDGVIKGGAQKRGPSVLSSLVEYKSAETVLSTKKAELDALQNEIRKITPIAQQYETMKGRAEVRSRELEMVRARIEQTTHFQLEAELKALEESIAENESKIKELKNEIKEKSSRVADLEHKMKNIHAIKEKQVATAEAELKKAKKRAEDSRAKWKQREQDFETLKLEIEELQKSLCLGKEQLAALQENIHQMQEDLKIKTEELRVISEDVKQKKADVNAKKTEIGQKNNEVQKRTTEKDNLVKYIEKCELDIVTQKIQQKKINEDMAETTRYISQMKKQYKWISEDRQYFMTPGGRYDLNSKDPKELVQRTNELKAQKERLEKNLNTKAMEILGNKEENFQDVMSKKEIIEEDRSKILSVIEELDVKKEEVLRVAWDKVNHDFHSILSSLLPNAMAKLKPIDGKDFTHGLEVKVGFSGIWKDSLDELSGGQRSLVALSLILAMLLFKPAPLYILDEVDAALDPSHTQNIGTMLKTHFRQSQFIVVSLKDGMFNNANVIFRTAFVDGMSTVIRTVNKK